MNGSQATASPALAGALSGLKAWTTYWVVESLFFAVSHTLHPPAEQFRQPDPWFADLALPVYMTAGALEAPCLLFARTACSRVARRRQRPCQDPCRSL